MIVQGQVDHPRIRFPRRGLSVLLTCASFFLIQVPASGAPSGDASAKISKIKVVCDNNYPPYAFVGADGSLEGIVPDHWKAWEKATGLSVDLRGLPWAEALDEIGLDQADVIDTIFETPARRLHYDFTPAYARIEVPVFIHRSISGIASVRDLKGFRVAVKSGDAAVSELLEKGVTELAPYDSYEAIIDEAAKLDERIFCVDKPPALYYLYKHGIDRDFKIAFILNQGDFHRAVKKERRELFALVEKGFAAISPSVYAAIDRKWLGSELERRVNLRVVAIVVATALALAVLLFVAAWGLRRRVRAATIELREKVALLERSEERNRASIAEKEVLLKEVHHRVKNNMQIISSLIQLKAGDSRLKGDQSLITDIQQRIQAMAQLHELLYHSRDFGSVDAAEYLDAISRELSLGYAWPDISCSAESISIGIDEALPLGLVAGELLINSLKYAYPEARHGPIRVGLRRRGADILLRVEDEGRGLPPGTDPLSCASMGFTIVRGLASQLHAEMSFGGPPGFWAEMSLPRSMEK
jgi:two-component sensor histidine kinase/ABC-type amino acid transport substrate-binding protein